MPSEFENLGNVVLEGLVRRIPCIATTGAPWQELISENCGWQVPYTQKDITKAISLAMSTSYEKLKEMGIVREEGQGLEINDISDLTFIHQDTGSKFKFTVDSSGELRS